MASVSDCFFFLAVKRMLSVLNCVDCDFRGLLLSIYDHVHVKENGVCDLKTEFSEGMGLQLPVLESLTIKSRDFFKSERNPSHQSYFIMRKTSI